MVGPIDVLQQVVTKLDNLKINYFLVGSLASMYYRDNSKPVFTAPSGQPPSLSDEPTSEESGLLGDWLGVKTGSQKAGIDLQASYKGDFYSILSGPERKESGLIGNLDLIFDLDLEKTFGFQGVHFFISGLGNHGDHPSEVVGDSFVSSNIEAPSTFKIYEAYFKKTFDQSFTILMGLRDLNADFNTTESSTHFINSSFGVSPTLAQTGANGPSIFPTAAPAITTLFQSKQGFYFATGLFNAISGNPNDPKGTSVPLNLENGTLLILESGFKSDDFFRQLSVGTWQYSKAVDRIDTTRNPTSENFGSYIMVDLALSQNLTLFSKIGIAAAAVNTFTVADQSGLVFKNPFGLQSDHSLFLGYSCAVFSQMGRKLQI